MIAPMKKLTVLCVESDQDDTLAHLRRLGVLHLAPFQPPEGEDVDKARKDVAHIARVLEVLPKRSTTPPSGRDALEVLEGVYELLRRRKDLEDRLEDLHHERSRMAPFGDFDPASLQALEAKGVGVRLYQCGPKERPAVPEGVLHLELGRTRDAVYFAVVQHGGTPVPVAAREVRLPAQSLSALTEAIAATEADLAAVQKDLDGHAGDRAVLQTMAEKSADFLRFLEARSGMSLLGPVACIRGFIPDAEVERLRAEAARMGWGLLIEEPAEEDAVPTLLKHPRWVEPIQALFRVIGILPGYREIDIGMVFLVFFSLFTAILIGDAGYGALFLGLTLWGRRKFRTAPGEIFLLLGMLSVSTMIWGVISGAYFGVTIGSGGPLARLKVAWLADADNVKYFCFLVGAIHLTIAHVWNIVRMRRSLQALAQVGWLCTTWTMFFVANKMVLGAEFPAIMMPVFLVGVGLIVLFMTPVRQLKEEWFNHAMLPLNLVSNFVDVVSYIRLFAVGMASLTVASSFNTMLAPMLGGWTAPIGALFLFLAHAFNITLSIMGVLVHGIRLNTLEFSGHIGMQWTGIPYEPFKQQAAAPGAERTAER